MLKVLKGLSLVSIGLTTFSFLFLSSSTVSADDSTVTDISITVPLVCTMSSTGMNSHTATINSGTYETNIGTTTLKAYCNDSNGFAIYATGYTGKTIGETNSNKLVGASTNQTITTGTATSGSTSNWAMKLAASGSSYVPTILNGFNSYHAVPNELTKVASYSSTTDIGTGATGSTITTTYQVFISSTQAADAYNGKVIYVMVHPSTHDTPVICNDSATTISEVKCMQDFSYVTDANRTAIVNSMTTGTQYTLKDKRDGKQYTIAKLADGNVWMTKNLDLDLDATVTYTNLDTDIGYNTTTGQYESASWSPIRSTYAATATHTHEWCVGGIWDSYLSHCQRNDTPESYDPGNLFWNTTISNYAEWMTFKASCNSNNTCDQTLNPIPTYTSSTGAIQYHLGNYYNWPSAIAMNDSSTITTPLYIAEQSICPAGWTLPRIGNGDDSFWKLWEEYGWDSTSDEFDNLSDFINAPLYYVAGGYFGSVYATGYPNGMLQEVGYTGILSAPVVNNDDNATSAQYFYGDNEAWPSLPGNRGAGYSIRCIARPVSTTISGYSPS